MLLYVRMIVTMVVSLYTSRVVLIALGVDDFGIFQTIAGVVGMFSFLNGALSTGTSRFLTFAMGEGLPNKLSNVFSSAFFLHCLMGLFIVLLCETIGLYLVQHRLVIPPDRVGVIFWVYQISIISSVLVILQVPYTADIISHEDMNVYAYMSIFDVAAKLLIAYLISIGNIDKLLLYAFLLFIVTCVTTLLYVVYCLKKYPESRFKGKVTKDEIKNMGSFSGWNLLSSSSAMLSNQGVLILLNLFFVPAVTAARAISLQINSVVTQFVNNYRLAAIPQMVKLYAQDNQEQSSRLVLLSTEISFYLIVIIGFPLLANTSFVLDLWLKDVPVYCVEFVQLIIIQSFVQTIDNSLYYGLYTCGTIKQNALISPVIALLGFPLCYIMFKWGYSPLAMSWVYIIVYGIIGIVVKPLLLVKYANYHITDIFKSIFKCTIVFIIGIVIWKVLEVLINGSMSAWAYLFLSSFVEIILLLIVVYFYAIDRGMRNKLNEIVFTKLKIKK